METFAPTGMTLQLVLLVCLPSEESQTKFDILSGFCVSLTHSTASSKRKAFDSSSVLGRTKVQTSLSDKYLQVSGFVSPKVSIGESCSQLLATGTIEPQS